MQLQLNLRRAARKTTTMAPSSSSSSPRLSSSAATTSRLFSSAAASPLSDDGSPLQGDSSTGATAAGADFPLHPDEANLFLIPSDLHSIYRPLPILMRIGVWFLAAAASVGWTGMWKNEIRNWSVKQVVGLVVKAMIMGLFTSTFLQEFLRPPSRISTVDLIRQYTLPSKLSRFEQVPLPSPHRTTNTTTSNANSDNNDLGVHYLYYENNTTTTTPTAAAAASKTRFQAIYFNHGFGASSLSWLPVLPRMVDRLGSRVGLGHDAVGFGFTDRPATYANPNAKGRTPFQRLVPYSTKGSSEIGTALLQRAIQANQKEDGVVDLTDDGNHASNDGKPVVLLGHSMGASATLKMALALPKTTPKWIILVAPALGMRSSGSTTSSTDNDSTEMSFSEKVAEVIFRGASVVGRYTLRRLVGGENFWRKGLRTVWGDPSKLSDSDILRFQWPSIGKGWEDGLLTFSRAMMQPSSASDAELIEQVLQPQTHATVTVILGSKDRVVPSEQIMNFFGRHCDKVKMVELEGLGHDSFEEDVEGFVRAVERVLEEDIDLILGSVDQ